MTLPNHLAERVGSLREAIERVDGLSVDTLSEDSRNTLDSIRGLVAEPEEIDDVLSDALVKIDLFASVYRARWQHGTAGNAQIDLMRRAALDNIDALETVLGGTKPSHEAITLGLG